MIKRKTRSKERSRDFLTGRIQVSDLQGWCARKVLWVLNFEANPGTGRSILWVSVKCAHWIVVSKPSRPVLLSSPTLSIQTLISFRIIVTLISTVRHVVRAPPCIVEKRHLKSKDN